MNGMTIRLPRKDKKELKKAFGPKAYAVWVNKVIEENKPIDMAAMLSKTLAEEINAAIIRDLIELGNNGR